MKPHSPRANRREVSILGFPTRIRPGFGIFLLVILIIYPAPLGIWVALAMGAFTVVHELGHALAARRSGCTASISLDFMVAFAAYSSPKELGWRTKVFITIAGPGLQIGSAVAVLFAMGVNPLDRNDITSSAASAAVWWAGIALGALNLVPLLPLDGGAIVAAIAERLAPGNGRTAVLYFSFGITVCVTAFVLYANAFGLLPILVFMAMMQWDQIARPRRMKSLVDNAELQATGDPRVDGMIIDSLVNENQMQRAYLFAREAYQLCPAFTNAYVCAVLSMQDNRIDDAADWIAAAYRSQVRANELATALSSDSQWDALRTHPAVSMQWFTHS